MVEIAWNNLAALCLLCWLFGMGFVVTGYKIDRWEEQKRKRKEHTYKHKGVKR